MLSNIYQCQNWMMKEEFFHFNGGGKEDVVKRNFKEKKVDANMDLWEELARVREENAEKIEKV